MPAAMLAMMMLMMVMMTAAMQISIHYYHLLRLLPGLRQDYARLGLGWGWGLAGLGPGWGWGLRQDYARTDV